MRWIDEIVAEAGRTFLQAARITANLFGYAALAIVALARKSGFHVRDVRLRGPRRDASAGQIEGKVCPVCGADNEATASHCFVCGHPF